MHIEKHIYCGEVLHLRPLNGPDPRTWLGKLMGELYEPIMPAVNPSEILHDTRRMNMENVGSRHCRISKIHIPHKERHHGG